MASAIKPTRKYPSGADFVKYTPEGGSFAFYPSGRMAAAYERMGSGFYCYFYADNKVGTTLSAFSPDGCGYVAFENNSKPRLTSTKTGGTSVNAEGLIDRSWTESKPLKSPIEISVTKNIVFRYANRRQITASLTCQGLTEEYILGDPPDRMDSYLQKSIGVVKMGPERGKQILDVDRCREAADAAREKREAFALKELGPSKKGHITQDFMQKHSQLRDIVRATDDLQASVREGKWNVEVFNNKSQLAATLGDSLPTLQLDPALMKGDPHSRLLTGMAATQPDTLEALLKDSVFDNRVLPLSNALKGASGRYRADHGTHIKTGRARLRELKAREYDTFIAHDAPKGTVVVVCCLAGWLPQCRRVEPGLEQLNGELCAAGEPEFVMCKYDMSNSRLLRDRHNIQTLPMYLMYYNGSLCYASNTLNGYGTGPADLRAQARATLLTAQQGAVLPTDFKFGLGNDNKMLESMATALGGTS